MRAVTAVMAAGTRLYPHIAAIAAQGPCFDKPPHGRALVTNHWRLSVRGGHGWDELYDLDDDPIKAHNI